MKRQYLPTREAKYRIVKKGDKYYPQVRSVFGWWRAMRFTPSCNECPHDDYCIEGCSYNYWMSIRDANNVIKVHLARRDASKKDSPIILYEYSKEEVRSWKGAL